MRDEGVSQLTFAARAKAKAEYPSRKSVFRYTLTAEGKKEFDRTWKHAAEINSLSFVFLFAVLVTHRSRPIHFSARECPYSTAMSLEAADFASWSYTWFSVLHFTSQF